MSPARDPARLRGIDAARGLAVLGMMAAHVAVPRTLELDEPATWLAITDGRSSILFATLAGLSIALMSGRERPVDGATSRGRDSGSSCAPRACSSSAGFWRRCRRTSP
ncbi:hypothetical protein BC477_16790 [Clavibacter michiganensis subsp. michiganensis]|uniref:Heparan-alpha-glucosaminide N-acetyltransferase catalytic domain-containing protein n=1 Tax=Clavibacter michiganensis subsp. michiganensis TaxID=33013 RepID=A0A251XDN7_CLAMM|nr:hypothetical protein BC477_16790 [Clavibacter michiganensis subsp. michiganensis]OUE00435.1 hypothetical protein CMMCAS07_18710 [Clavibacter michiganensis subsp. michiganensis]